MDQFVRQKIYREFAAKRERALADAQRRKEALYAAVPALQELDARAAQASAEYVRARLMGEGQEETYHQTMAEISERRAELMQGADILPHFSCEICEDTGKVAGGYCKCFQRRVIEENLADANLSVGSQNERFENFDLSYYSATEQTGGKSHRDRMRRNLERCREFVRDFDTPGKSLILAGTSGLGKTFLSSAIAHELLEKGHTVIYLSATEFFSRASANKFGDGLQEMQTYYDADLLILDDLGTEFRTQFTSSVLSELIDRRLRKGKKMVFSTNLGPSELENNYSARIISRFVGGFDVLFFVGDDIRIQKKGKK